MLFEKNSYLEQIELWCASHNPSLTLSYQVPLLGEGGTCSLFGELDETPFDLASQLHEHELQVLKQVQSVVDWVHNNTKVDWFGVYLARDNSASERVLTKLSYFGKPSRAEFPLNEEFSKISNNVTVALTGHHKIINDVSEYRANGGEYYTCDPKVQSELCWPIFSAPNNCLQNNNNNNLVQTSPNQKIVGIIDAECFATDSFDGQTQQKLAAVCTKLSNLLSLH